MHKFSTLDGLRGVAAISVMAYHRRDWFGGEAFFGHAFLAVDFFFLLSGFVLAHAYGRRLADRKMLAPFIRDRLVRLHPMLIAGSTIAMVVAALEARASGARLEQPVILWFAHSVPFPAIWGTWQSAFPWNIAIWSLFWELLANLIFAIFLPWLTNRILYTLVSCSVITMVIVSAEHTGFEVGFARDLSQFVLGFPRVIASFFLGVLIYRNHTIKQIQFPFLDIFCAFILLVTFIAVPHKAPFSTVYDPLVAYVLYPCLLIAASRARPTHAGLAALFGAISYPLYVIHEPMLRVLGGTLQKVGLSDGHPGHLEAILRLCAVVFIAFLVLKFYDEPIRRKLTRFFKGRRLQ